MVRDNRVYSRWLRRQSRVIGTVAASTTRPSGQYIRTSRAATTAICTTFMIRNSAPKPRKRRMVERSFMIRDSSWPDCQRSWKLIGSRCSWAYRSRRMPVSTPIVPLVTIQRRPNISAASTTPSVMARAPSAYSPTWSESAIGPSITALVTSGTTIVAPTPRAASTIMAANRVR